MNLIEQIGAFIRSRDCGVLHVPHTENKIDLVVACWNLLDHLRLYCRLDRERTLLVTGTGPLAGFQILRGHPEFHRIFEVEELAYGLKIGFHPELPEEERRALIQTACEGYKPLRERPNPMGPK